MVSSHDQHPSSSLIFTYPLINAYGKDETSWVTGTQHYW